MKTTRAFTLIELMMVVAIVGVLAGLALYGVRTYTLHSKTSEARNAVGQLSKDAVTAYHRESIAGGLLAGGSAAGVSNCICGSSSVGVPALVPPKGTKYQSAPSEWLVDASTTGKGFACLKFSMSDPQYYRYSYDGFNPSRGLCDPGATFNAQAVGDLDADGTNSQFTVTGQVQADGAFFVAPNIREQSPEE